MFEKIIEIFKNLMRPTKEVIPDWEQPDFNLNNYDFFTETLPRQVKNYHLISLEDKLTMLHFGQKALKQNKGLIVNFNHVDNPHDLKRYPKVVSCELCSTNDKRAFISAGYVPGAFTKKNINY